MATGISETESGQQSGTSAPRGLISLRALRKIYIMGDQEVRALDGVDLDIKKGEFVAIMGPSGSGKSTLMNLIGCLDTPTSGSFLLNGQEVSTMDENQLADLRNREIGFVFQTFNLLPRTSALQNVELPLVYAGISRQERRKRAHETLERVQLEDRATHAPSELSGGQRQRVAVARALVNNPSLLLADEPTGNLDSKTSLDIMGLFSELHQAGNTIILVTHEPDIAAYANRTIKLLDGRIVSDIGNSPGGEGATGASPS